MARTRTSSPIAEIRLAWSWMPRPGTSTGPTWAFRIRTTARSNARTSTARIARRSCPPGGTFTPKQLHLEKKTASSIGRDREGMRVMRANLDGSKIETLVDTSQGDARPGRDEKRWCVGITVDPKRGKIYWTQKGPDNGETRAESVARTSKSRKARARPTARTSKCCSTVCRSRLTSNSISKTASCIGRTAETRRAATR